MVAIAPTPSTIRQHNRAVLSTTHDVSGSRSPRGCNGPYRMGAAGGGSGEALATQLTARARLTESTMNHPDHFISVILCQFRVSPLTRLMLWVCFNSWTFMLAELLKAACRLLQQYTACGLAGRCECLQDPASIQKTCKAACHTC